jgi:N-acetylglutamate synthase-like GNAT family acetyltransferase
VSITEYGWRSTGTPGLYMIVDQDGNDVGCLSFLPHVERQGLMASLAVIAWNETGLLADT